MDVALVGLGQMGSGMAANLLAAGHQVTVWNRDRTKTERFAALGATVAADLAEAARANTVLTMLADDAAVEAVVFGNGGLLAAGSGLLHVSCSTVSVDLAGRLAAAHAAAGQSKQTVGHGRGGARQPRLLLGATAGRGRLVPSMQLRPGLENPGAAGLALRTDGAAQRVRRIDQRTETGKATAWSNPGRSTRSSFRTESGGRFHLPVIAAIGGN